MKQRTLVRLLLGVLLTSSPFAWGAAEYVPLQERAQGQSLAGASLLNDSLYSNPASSAFTQVYSVDANMLMPRSFAISVLDTKTSQFGGSLGYFRRFDSPDATAMNGAKLGGTAKLGQWLGVGAAGKVIWGPGTDGRNNKLTDVDFGALANFDFLNLGLTIRNLFGGEKLLSQERELGVGMRVNYKNTLFFSASALSRFEAFKPYQYGFGTEYVSPYYFALKGGFYFQPDSHFSAWTGGLSFISPRVSLHYAVEFPQTPDRKPEHQIGMTMLF